MEIERSRKHMSFGMLFMFGSGLCFVAVIGLVRNLEGALPAAQASFLRYLLATPTNEKCLFNLIEGNKYLLAISAQPNTPILSLSDMR